MLHLFISLFLIPWRLGIIEDVSRWFFAAQWVQWRDLPCDVYAVVKSGLTQLSIRPSQYISAVRGRLDSSRLVVYLGVRYFHEIHPRHLAVSYWSQPVLWKVAAVKNFSHGAPPPQDRNTLQVVRVSLMWVVTKLNYFIDLFQGGGASASERRGELQINDSGSAGRKLRLVTKTLQM